MWHITNPIRNIYKKYACKTEVLKNAEVGVIRFISQTLADAISLSLDDGLHAQSPTQCIHEEC
jgi:hypothetical protein